MPLGDVSYQNDALDAVVASWPGSGATYRLYAADPAATNDYASIELTSDGGYTPVAFDPADWDPAADGAVTTTAPVTYPTSTAAYSDTATHWAIVDSGDLIVFSDALTDQIVVDAAGVAAAFSPSLSFADGA